MKAIWIVWFLLFVATFAVLEGYAIHTGRPTLSETVWDMSDAWPPLSWVAGVVVGGLAVHFWWRSKETDDEQ
jgi:hypothetical protein